jgi:hypothetical protein
MGSVRGIRLRHDRGILRLRAATTMTVQSVSRSMLRFYGTGSDREDPGNNASTDSNARHTPNSGSPQAQSRKTHKSGSGKTGPQRSLPGKCGSLITNPACSRSGSERVHCMNLAIRNMKMLWSHTFVPFKCEISMVNGGGRSGSTVESSSESEPSEE